MVRGLVAHGPHKTPSRLGEGRGEDDSRQFDDTTIAIAPSDNHLRNFDRFQALADHPYFVIYAGFFGCFAR